VSQPPPTQVCRTCKVEKVKLRGDLKSPAAKIYYYVDETGAKWNGRRCPQCNLADIRRRSKGLYRRKRGLL
jgi:hypothetical protein